MRAWEIMRNRPAVGDDFSAGKRVATPHPNRRRGDDQQGDKVVASTGGDTVQRTTMPNKAYRMS